MKKIFNNLAALTLFIVFTSIGLFSVNNVIADAEGEVFCFSQSVLNENLDYYDCGTCTKIDGRQASGPGLKCTP